MDSCNRCEALKEEVKRLKESNKELRQRASTAKVYNKEYYMQALKSNEAYNEGYSEGYNEGWEDLKEQFRGLLGL